MEGRKEGRKKERKKETPDKDINIIYVDIC
jgi:hypothetical protein